MGMDEQTKTALRENFEQVASQLKSQYPDLTDADLEKAKSDPDGFAQAVAQKTGHDKQQVTAALTTAVQSVQTQSQQR